MDAVAEVQADVNALHELGVLSEEKYKRALLKIEESRSEIVEMRENGAKVHEISDHIQLSL